MRQHSSRFSQTKPVLYDHLSYMRLPSPTMRTTAIFASQTDANRDDIHDTNISEVSSKFTVKVCTSSTCSNRRRSIGKDDSSLLANFYERLEYAGVKGLRVEETNCLGQCKKGPCVAVEHDDYEGSVALEGMLPMEFNRRCFLKVQTQEDTERIWSCVENAIIAMAQESLDNDVNFV